MLNSTLSISTFLSSALSISTFLSSALSISTFLSSALSISTFLSSALSISSCLGMRLLLNCQSIIAHCFNNNIHILLRIHTRHISSPSFNYYSLFRLSYTRTQPCCLGSQPVLTRPRSPCVCLCAGGGSAGGGQAPGLRRQLLYQRRPLRQSQPCARLERP